MRKGIEVVVYAERGGPGRNSAPKVKGPSPETPAEGTVASSPETPGVQGGVEWGLVAPEYPEEARRRGEEGDVLLLVGFRDDGKAASVALERTSGSSYLDRAALESVRKQISAGDPASSSKVIKIQFKLK